MALAISESEGSAGTTSMGRRPSDRPAGQKWQGGYPSRKDAERGLRESLTALDTGSWTEPTKLTYATYVSEVWLPQIRDQIESSTLESYELDIRVQCCPASGQSASRSSPRPT